MNKDDAAPGLFGAGDYTEDDLFADDRQNLAAAIAEEAPPIETAPPREKPAAAPAEEVLSLPLEFSTLADLGDYFRTLREKQRRSIDQVSAETRIKARYIAAIEAGDAGALPPVFVIAYIRKLAQLYRVDVATLEGLFDELRASGSGVEMPEDVNKIIVGRAEDETQVRRRNQLALILLAVSVIVVAAVVAGVVWLVMLVARGGGFESGARLTEEDLLKLQKPALKVYELPAASPVKTGQKR